MRYFQKEWHFAWNDFSEDSYARNLRAVHEQNAAFIEYWKHLEGLRQRISPELFRLLRYPDDAEVGYARLINLAMTDYPLGSTHTATGRKRRPRPQATLELQDEKQRSIHTLTFRRIQKVSVDFPSDEPFGWHPLAADHIHETVFDPEKKFGDVYLFELTAVDEDVLAFELLLTTGGTIAIHSRDVSYMNRVC